VDFLDKKKKLVLSHLMTKKMSFSKPMFSTHSGQWCDARRSLRQASQKKKSFPVTSPVYTALLFHVTHGEDKWFILMPAGDSIKSLLYNAMDFAPCNSRQRFSSCHHDVTFISAGQTIKISTSELISLSSINNFGNIHLPKFRTSAKNVDEFMIDLCSAGMAENIEEEMMKRAIPCEIELKEGE
jgi:hypothetical protein